MTHRCQWCGVSSPIVIGDTRCPHCRAPWPTLGQAVGLREQPTPPAPVVDGQVPAWDVDDGPNEPFRAVMLRLGL